MPEAQIENGLWTQGYLPIDATEFRRLTETVHARAIGSPGAAAAEIEVADYTATLVDGDMLVGTAVLQLAQPAKSAPALERWLLLAPCSFALSDARWEDAASAAMLGTGPDGVLRVKADHGRLRCTWSLRAQRSASGAIVFPIDLPRAPTTRLSIDAPSNLELMADRGIAGSSPGSAADTTRWTFELGGLSSLSLRAVTEGNARERRSLTLLRQSSTYEMSSRGVNLSTQLKLDIHSEALQRLSLDLDPELRLVSARYGELQIPFAVVRDAKTGASRVSLELPEPISGASRVLQLSAMSPLVVDKRWRLPGLRVEGMSWQEGTATLLIPGGLLLEQLATDGCRQSRIATLPAPARGESLEIQFFRPTASIDVLLVHPPEQLQIQSGAAVDVGQHEITSRTTLEVGAKRGSRRFLPVTVRSGWTIDAVEDLAANRPLDWEVDDRPDAENTLNIHLADVVVPERTARLVVRGHRAAGRIVFCEPSPGDAGACRLARRFAADRGTRRRRDGVALVGRRRAAPLGSAATHASRIEIVCTTAGRDAVRA